MNQVRCLECGALLMLNTHYRLIYCPCGSTGVDGGPDYVRILGDHWVLVNDRGEIVDPKSYYPSEEE